MFYQLLILYIKGMQYIHLPKFCDFTVMLLYMRATKFLDFFFFF